MLNALLIGAGETIELVATTSAGIKRSVRHHGGQPDAQPSAGIGRRFCCRSDSYCRIFPDYLARADIVISSTASQLPVLGKGAVESALKKRKHKPIFMVDIAVPRDIEPEVEECWHDVYLYTVDDLQEVIQDNLRARQDPQPNVGTGNCRAGGPGAGRVSSARWRWWILSAPSATVSKRSATKKSTRRWKRCSEGQESAVSDRDIWRAI